LLLAPSLLVSAAAIALVLVVVLCTVGKYREAAAASLITLAVSYVLVARVSIETLLIFWFATTPLASFYARFPLDKTIISYNRAVIAFAVVMLLWNRWAQGKQAQTISPLEAQPATLKSSVRAGFQQSRLRYSATKFEIVWVLLSLIALGSAIMQSNDATYAVRIAVDSFWLPLVMFHLAPHHFSICHRCF